MTILLATGFEAGTLSPGDNLVSNPKRSGNYCFYFEWFGNRTFSLPARSELFMSYAYMSTQGTGVGMDFVFSDGGTISLRQSGSSVTAYVNNTLVATSEPNMALEREWLHIQVRVHSHAQGKMQVKANGRLLFDLDINTIPISSTVINAVKFSASYTHLYIDDIVVDDATWPGDVRFVALTPAADTVTKEWTPSSGNDNFSRVNTRPASDATYVESATDGARDLYNFSPWANAGLTAKAVVLWTRSLMTNANGQSVKQIVKSGDTLHASGERTLSLAPQYFYEILEHDPATGQAWTAAAINAIQAGHEAVVP